MILYYVRHGQSANNAMFDQTGSDQNRVQDPELTETGLRQAERVAGLLASGQPLERSRPEGARGFGITHLYSSLMVRAVNTAQPIAQALDLPIRGWKDLHEGGGIFLEDPVTGVKTGYPGATREQFAARFPELAWPADAARDGWWNRPFEEPEERPLRAKRVLDELLRRHGNTEDRVAIVSHGGFFYWFMNAVLETTPRRDQWFHMFNTGVTAIEFSEHRGAGIRYLNRLDHLPFELIT